MNTRDFITTLLPLLLGAGGLAFVRAIFRGLRSLRSGARSTERAAIADLNERAAVAEDDRDYWRGVAGGYHFQLTRVGEDPDPPSPVPPSRRPPPKK